jgi:hypothetical protein
MSGQDAELQRKDFARRVYSVLLSQGSPGSWRAPGSVGGGDLMVGSFSARFAHIHGKQVSS